MSEKLTPHKMWTCKIGILGDMALPKGADSPMRQAAYAAFEKLTGREADFNFSGWGDQLTECEMAVVENRTPAPEGEVMAGSCKTCHSERPASPCWKCGGEVRPVAAGWEWPGLTDISRIRELAREVGYAVGVHGSMQRDQDLIAVPWVADAVSPLELAQHIASGLGGEAVDYETQDKPCGRWSCNIHTPDWTKLIDLSVMPPASPVVPVGVRERVLDELDRAWLHGQRRTSWRRDEAADAILAALRPTDTGRQA